MCVRRKMMTIAWTMALGGILLSDDVLSATPQGWPCDQVYNPNISLPTVWQGPDVAARLDSWWESPYVSNRDNEVLRILFDDMTLTQEDTQELIATFAKSVPSSSRSDALLDLFAAMYSSVLELYQSQLKSILRFVARQDKVAERTSEKASDMRALRRQGVGSTDERYLAVQAEMEWNVRVFDERNRLTPYICEEPVFLKQQLGFRARAILSLL